MLNLGTWGFDDQSEREKPKIKAPIATVTTFKEQIKTSGMNQTTSQWRFHCLREGKENYEVNKK